MAKRSFSVSVGCVAVIAATVFICPALADDLPGSKDHPLVGRYQGSSITDYRHVDFDEGALLQAPIDFETDALIDRTGAEWLKAEGALTEIRYAIPEGSSSLAVLRNYEQALKTAGFATMFSCADQACFAGTMNDPYLLGQQIDTRNGISTAYFDHARYMLASRDDAGGKVYVSLLTGEVKSEASAFLTVLETKAMAGDKVEVKDAAALAKALDSGGSVDVYGIYFNSAEAGLKAESTPTLNEIDRLMSDRPDLKLEIVGHTDSVGGADYNMDLSLRRAANVVAALTETYGIAADRLSSSGAGLTRPVASNDSEEGRARNRRVELRSQ